MRSLNAILTRLPRQNAAAIIVILQHREALDEEQFRQALKETDHELSVIADGQSVLPGHIYLPASNRITSVENGQFRSYAAEQQAGMRGTIDSFLVSLASDEDGHSIAVVLAGTGDDGTLGFKAVKEAGGLTLAEETEEARAGELASSNTPAALADAVLPIDGITERILSSVRQLDRSGGADVKADQKEVGAALAAISTILRNKTGHDFHGYKPGTFLRRVSRRMQVVQVATIQDYLEILRTRHDEAQQLFNDLLIGVTQFFRDAREYEILAQQIPRLFAGKTREDQLRVWVIGCSTGEEAYSIGILLREHMDTLDSVPHVQIFATDLDGRALASARSGRYASTAAADLTPERLARWFVKEGNTYCVTKELREMCIFSQHSVITDDRTAA